MVLFINPGSGPVADATHDNAVANMEALQRDLEVPSSFVADGTDRGDGRFRFELEVEGRPREVDMPGLPLERVRWLDQSSGSIWDFPRLYVDGSSWIWVFALDVLKGGGE